jgi:hypothetical protein
VTLSDTRFHDPADAEAPAHARLRILSLRLDGSVTAEDWLLAESWWAESFPPPTFSDLALWGLRIVPWIVGSHFASQVKRQIAPSDADAAGPDGMSAFLQRTRRHLALAAAFAAFIAGLVASVAALPVLALLLVLAAIPVPKLRSALLRALVTPRSRTSSRQQRRNGGPPFAPPPRHHAEKGDDAAV